MSLPAAGDPAESMVDTGVQLHTRRDHPGKTGAGEAAVALSRQVQQCGLRLDRQNCARHPDGRRSSPESPVQW
jgi:hypothetical protein